MRFYPVALIVLAFGAVTCAAEPDADWDFRALRDAYVGKLKPLAPEAAARWEAMATGSQAALARQKAAEKALVEVNNDRELFAQLKPLKESDRVRNPVLRRELDVLYHRLLPAQANRQLQARIVDL